jgi:hypothetical protein
MCSSADSDSLFDLAQLYRYAIHTRSFRDLTDGEALYRTCYGRYRCLKAIYWACLTSHLSP